METTPLAESRHAMQAGHLELQRTPDGWWRWWYLDGAEHRALASNRSFPNQEEALASARLAFPGAAVVRPQRPEPARRRRGRLGPWILAGAVGALAVGAGVIAYLAWRDRLSAGRARARR